MGKRIVRYELGIQRCAYIGAGYGGVFLLAGLGGDRVFATTWWWIEPTLASVLTLGILLLAWAYLSFAWALRDLRLRAYDATPPVTAGTYPRVAHWMYVASFVPLVAATMIVLASTWIAASAQMPEPAQPTTVVPSSTP
ncbi:hypothetical protein GCM10027406_14060 [Leifsonia lichenia]